MAGRLSVRDVSRSPLALTATAITVAVVLFLYWARVVVIPLALAIFFTFILSPAVTALRRRGVGRVLSVVVVSVAALVVVLGVGGFMTWQMAALVTELPNHGDNIRAKLNSVNSWIGSTSKGPVATLIADIEQALKFGATGNANDIEPVAVVMASSEDGWQRSLGTWFGPVAESLARIALTLLLTIFLLLGKEDMRNRVLRIIGPRRLTASTKAVDDAATRISRYLRIQLLINASFGVAVAISLLALQVPYALLWGFIAGVMRYVPYIGAWLGLFPPLLASLAMTGSWWQPILVVTSYAVLEILINSLVEPRLFGKSLGISEVAQIVSAAFWAFLWGPIGLILSGPMTACLLVLGKNVPQLRCFDVLLGDEESLPPSTAFFQRLAARDRDEAWHVARQYATANSPERVADGLLLPALALTQSSVDRHDLSDEDGVWIVTSIREIADDFTEPAPTQEPESKPLADDERVRLLLVPGSDRCDDLAMEILAQRLDPASWEVIRLSTDTLASEMLSTVRTKHPAVVIVGTVAAGEAAHTRYLCKRLRFADPSIKLFVGRWGLGELSTTQRADLTEVGVDEITTELSAMQTLLSASRAMFEDSAGPIHEPAKENHRVGTASALIKA